MPKATSADSSPIASQNLRSPRPIGHSARSTYSARVGASVSVVQGLAAARDVVDARPGPEIFLVPVGVVVLQEPRQTHGLVAVRGDVLDEVTDVDRLHAAGLEARRQLPVVRPGDAEHALAHRALLLRDGELGGRLVEGVVPGRGPA